jgi:hypothetical protein
MERSRVRLTAFLREERSRPLLFSCHLDS